MAAPCFTSFSPVLPVRAKVRHRLTGGEAGKRIYDAVTAGDEAAAVRMLRQDPALIRTAVRFTPGERPYDGNDGDLLSFAVAACAPRMVALLLELGSAPDGERPGVALGYALLADSPDMAEMLLAAGASPEPRNAETEQAPFDVALQFGNVGAVRMLVRHGLKLDKPDAFGNTYLHGAAAIRAFRIAEVLVDAGANPWRIGMGGVMPVHAIARAGDETGEEEAARVRLVSRVRKDGLPWPPPPAGDVRDLLLRDGWPETAMQAAGMVAAPAVVDRLRARR